MAPIEKEVRAMVVALFTLNAGLERARRQSKGASALSLLQVIADHKGIRPSDIAELQQVHPSLVTRQLQELDEAGFVAITPDPSDGRSSLVAITPAGTKELRRLVNIGFERFTLFVADWTTDEVRAFTRMLEKFQQSKAAAANQPHQTGRRWRGRARARISLAKAPGRQ